MTHPHYPNQSDQTIPVGVNAKPKRKARVEFIVVGIFAAMVILCCIGGIVFAANSDSGKKGIKDGVAVSTPTTGAPSALPVDPLAVAPTEPPVEESTQPEMETFDLPLGTTITVTTNSGTIDVTVSKSKKYPTARKTSCKQYMPKPDNGFYLVFDVKMEVKKGTGSINPLYFTYVSPDGATDEGFGGAFAGCGDMLDSGNDLRAGTKRSGQLVFDSSSSKGVIEFGGSFFGGTEASWKIG